MYNFRKEEGRIDIYIRDHCLPRIPKCVNRKALGANKGVQSRGQMQRRAPNHELPRNANDRRESPRKIIKQNEVKQSTRYRVQDNGYKDAQET